MTVLVAPDPDFAARVRDSFERQGLMGLIGATLTRLEPGAVDIEMPFTPDISQQHGFFHGGAVAAIADSAGGYSALSLFSAGDAVLTVEFKVNFCAPAKGDRLRAEGRVIKPGRTLTLTDVAVYARDGDGETLCAKMQQTMMRLEGRPDTVWRTSPEAQEAQGSS